MSFRSAVVGLGGIGMEFDYDQNESMRCLTHASGFVSHPAFELVGGVDLDLGQRHRFKKKYNKTAFSSVSDLFEETSPEVVSIAVPTHACYSVFSEVIAYSPKAVVLEKPMASTLDEAKQINAMAASNECVLLVNYMRRFEPGVIELRNKILGREFGEIYKGTVWYSNGVFTNGSHFIDLFSYLLGEITGVTLIGPGRTLENGDIEPDFKIEFGSTQVFCLAACDEFYSFLEWELVGSAGCIRYSNAGQQISFRMASPDRLFPAYKILTTESIPIQTDLGRYQIYVLDALYESLKANVPLQSTGKTALCTMSVLHQLQGLVMDANDV